MAEKSRYYLRYAGKGQDFAELYEVVNRASGEPTGPAQPRAVAEKNLEAMESLGERSNLTPISGGLAAGEPTGGSAGAGTYDDNVIVHDLVYGCDCPLCRPVSPAALRCPPGEAAENGNVYMRDAKGDIYTLVYTSDGTPEWVYLYRFRVLNRLREAEGGRAAWENYRRAMAQLNAELKLAPLLLGKWDADVAVSYWEPAPED